MEGGDGGTTMVNGRAEIDTRPPFRSVKEAVSLFGERVFTPDFHSAKLKAIAQKRIYNGSNPESMTSDQLERTKQNLEKAQEETKSMANQMYCLKEELEKTKRELQELKDLQESKRQLTKMMADLQDMEDLKYLEISPSKRTADEEENEMELQKRRYVTFAHPTPSKIVLPAAGGRAVLERNPSLTEKKKPFTIPLIGGIFPRRKTKYDR